MRRFGSRLFLAVLLTCTAACALAPAVYLAGERGDGSQPTHQHGRDAARALLNDVVHQVLRDDTGTFSSEVHFRQGTLVWDGNYGIHTARAKLEIRFIGPGRAAREPSTEVEVVLDGRKAYVRETSVGLSVGRWIEASRRHIFPDLACWPARHRRLPDRSLMLLFSAEADRLEGDRNRSEIIATVPARLASVVFPDPSLAELVSNGASAPVVVHIGNFRGQLTTIELEGEAVKAALERAGVPLDRNSARALSAARYYTYFSNFGFPLLVRPPAPTAVLGAGRDAPLPQAQLPCVNTRL